MRNIFLRGKLSKEWAVKQYQYALRHDLVKASQHWLRWFIRFLANNAFDLWEQRNRKRHGDSTPLKYASQLAQAQRDVTVLYSLREKVLARDQDLFATSLDEVGGVPRRGEGVPN